MKRHASLKKDKNCSFFRLLCKFTGYDYLRNRYKKWKVKRVKISSSNPTKSFEFESETSSVKQMIHDIYYVDSMLTRITVNENEKSRYALIRTLGIGSFSKVKLATDKLTDGLVAIKLIEPIDCKEFVMFQNNLLREIQITSTLNHPSIIKFKQVTMIDNKMGLVMEYVEGLELFDWVIQNKALNEASARNILRQLLHAIKYLHSNQIVHRDLKLENILITMRGIVKLIDFGLATHWSPFLSTRCGSEDYAAPEVLLGQPYDGKASDIWSFGVIMYACLMGSLPFTMSERDTCTTRNRILSIDHESTESKISPPASDIIARIFVKDPGIRITVDQLLAHPWFNQ